MVRIHVSDYAQHNQSHAFFVYEGQDATPLLKTVFNNVPELMTAFLKREDFTGQAGKIVSLPYHIGDTLLYVFFIGLGKPADHNVYSVEVFRRGLGSLIKALQKRKFTTCTLSVPSASLFKVTDKYLAKQIAVIADMAMYHFDDYITDESRKSLKDMSLVLLCNEGDKKEIEDGIVEGSIVGTALNKVRHLIDLPPSTLTPAAFAHKAQEVAHTYGLKITVFDEPDVNKMGMGGLSAVAAGSEQDCKFIIMEYKTAEKNAPTLAFVGKGITFDSGGLSIKPAQAMEEMKDDMSGASAVLGAMQVIAQLKPHVNVIGFMPLAENLPSGTALKPGDIIRFYNGKTAEVRNTDAEGRLILADALSYAVKHYKPDAMIDIATLTGACAYALGPFYTGIMGKHKDLLTKIEHAAEVGGERVWQLPFDDDYKKAIISDVADICNIGKSHYRAGAITAGFFLSHFVGDVPWVHMDIAGTSFNVPDISYIGSGATGAAMRILVELAVHWK